MEKQSATVLTWATSNRGLINSFGAYQEYYSSGLLKHKSAPSISWIGTIQGSLLEILGLFIGPIFDAGYFHALIYTGGFLIVLGTMLLSLCTSYWQVFLAQGICIAAPKQHRGVTLPGVCPKTLSQVQRDNIDFEMIAPGIGTGLIFTPSVAIIASAFTKRRPIAIGLATSGSSIGGVVYPIVFRHLRPRIGFAWTTRAIGFIELGTLMISFVLIRFHKAERRKPRSLIDKQAFRELPFMLYGLALTLVFCGYFVPFFYMPAYAIEHLHTTRDLAFYLLAVANASALLGRLVPGFVPRLLATAQVLPLATVVGGVLVFAWIAVRSTAGFVVFCILYGIVSGIISTMATLMTPELSPPGAVFETIGSRLGMVYFGYGIGILIGSPIAGAITNTSHGDFIGTQVWTGATLLGGAAALIYPSMHVRRVKSRQHHLSQSESEAPKNT